MNLQDLHIDNSWTLFLDRDGVINKNIEGGYVLSLEMFEWIDGSIEAIASLSKIFGRIIIVTNQQGVGKGLMSENDLSVVHNFMKTEIEKQGGRVDAIYYSPYLNSENHPMRKPGTGMPLQAQKDFPEIDFSKSILVGDSEGDMEMAEKLHLKKVFIKNSRTVYLGADFNFNSLNEFADALSFLQD